jgi:hypothetical protein
LASIKADFERILSKFKGENTWRPLIFASLYAFRHTILMLVLINLVKTLFEFCMPKVTKMSIMYIEEWDTLEQTYFGLTVNGWLILAGVLFFSGFYEIPNKHLWSYQKLNMAKAKVVISQII